MKQKRPSEAFARPGRALVCARALPAFDRESSKRLYDLVLFLSQAGWEVTVTSRQGMGRDQYVRLLAKGRESGG